MIREWKRNGILLVAMISSLVGVAIIALPSGIITAAYMDEINKNKSKSEL